MKKVITFGEIMLRLSPPGFLRLSQANSFDINFGGSESNVAISLANFGIPTDFVTCLPENDIGLCALRELRKHGVGTNHIIYGGERLGIYFLETGAVNRGSKVVYDRSNSAISTIETGKINWSEIFADAGWFHWSGITPAISQNAANVCREAIEAANNLGITVSTDFNYRSKLWNYGKKPSEVMPELVEGCDIILANEKDAAQHYDIHPENSKHTHDGEMNSEAYLSVFKQLMERLPSAKKIISTQRGAVSASHNSWSAVLYNGKNLLQAPTYEITHIVDRVGGGDSFVAGLIYGLLNYNEDDQKALDFAVAASSLKHTIAGDVNLVTVDEVTKLMEGDSAGKVAR